MRKILPFFIMMSLASVSCNKSDGSSSNDNTSTEVTNETPGSGTDTSNPNPSTSLPNAALTFDANITMVGFSADQEAKYNKAIEIVKMVVATEEFRTRVLNYTYNGKKTYANNGGKTNAQIYQSILDAAESLQPAKNNTMDLEVELYYANNTVVGYTNGSTKRIWVNTKYFNTYSANSVAGNLMHEWLHKLGYGHDSAATAQRPYSVPYAIGSMMSSLGKNFL